MKITVRRKLAIGVVVLAAAAFGGGAYAAAEASGTSAQRAFLNDVAKRLNVTPKQLSAALKGAYLDQVQDAVRAGKLTQAQANAIRQRAAARHRAAGRLALARAARDGLALRQTALFQCGSR